MVKRIHTTARGLIINFDELARQNPDVIAVGNASMNARGDHLGEGGKIIRKVSDIPQHLQPNPDAAYNENNPNAVKQVSIKSSIDSFMTSSILGTNPNIEETFTKEELSGEGAKTPQEIIKELAKKDRAVKKESSKSKRKLVDIDE